MLAAGSRFWFVLTIQKLIQFLRAYEHCQHHDGANEQAFPHDQDGDPKRQYHHLAYQQQESDKNQDT
jgi:hypothetical protein